MVKKGTKAIQNSLKPVKATARQDEDELFKELAALPEDPKDARLTVSGAVVGKDGKVDVAAYEDLQSAYAGEPPPSSHPYPDHPGVKSGEEIPQGLRIWDDLRAGHATKDGAGWIAKSTKKGDGQKEKWFNIRTCGSWRLAFLLARLQRQLWEAGKASSAASTAAAAGEEKAATDKAADTPPRKRPAPAPTPTGKATTARKQARRTAEAGKAPAPAEKAPPPAFAGSARFAEIMAARKAQEEAAAAKAAGSAAPPAGAPAIGGK